MHSSGLISVNRYSLIGIMICCLLSWVVTVPVLADGIVVQQASSRLMNDHFVIDAEIDYEFTDVALEALENGVPLTVDIHVQVRRDGAWIWEKDIIDFHKRRQLRYLPLSSTYEVIGFKGEEKRQFVSRLAAIEALGEIRNMSVVSLEQLEAGETYRMEIRSELDIESLPVPLRPTAYMSSAWSLSSDWSRWHIRP